MKAWPAWARSRRAGALLGAAAVLLAGCTTAGGGSGPPADRTGPAGHSAAASPPGRVAAHRIAGTPGPGSITHGSGPGIGRASSLAWCTPPPGDRVVNRAGAAPRLRAAAPARERCCWCDCAWACCGCGPGRGPPGWWPRSRLAWQCCPRWLGPPDGDSSPIWPVCGPGCGSRACPVGPPGPLRVRSRLAPPRGAAAGAS
jgi:hypothetical protein